MTLRRKRFCCSKEQFDPQEMFKTGSTALIEGSVERTEPSVMFTTMPDSKLSCCKNITAVELESELLYIVELDIRMAGTSRVASAPPPHANTRSENAASTPEAVMELFSSANDAEFWTKIPPPLTNTLIA